MARTAADLKTESLLGFDSTTYGTYVDNWLKDALEEIATRAGGSQTPISTQSLSYASSVTTATLNSDHYIIPYGVQYTDASGNVTILEELTPQEYDSLPTSLGTPPLYFSRAGQTISIWPTPNTAISLTVLYLGAQGTAFSGAAALGTAPYVKDWFADAIVCFCRYRLFRLEDDPEMANYWEQQYERNLSKIAQEYRRDVTPKQVPGMWGWTSDWAGS